MNNGHQKKAWVKYSAMLIKTPVIFYGS